MQRSCLFASSVCLLLFVCPGFHYRLTDTGSGKQESTTFTLGLPGSPWLSLEAMEANGLHESSTRVHLFSVSWMFLTVAVVLAFLWRKSLRDSMDPPVQES